MKIKVLLSFYNSSETLAKKIRFAAINIATVIYFVLISITASATIYNVNTTADGTSSSGTINLRGAITAADVAGGTHTINIPAGTYDLTLGNIKFGNRAENITIVGADSGTTIINMTTANRIFFVNSTGGVTAAIVLTVSKVRFRNGNLTEDNFGGGAVRLVGPNITASFTACAFENNMVNPAKNSGGGAIRCASGGTLSIDQCSFTGNSCPANSTVNGAGGAILFQFYSYSIMGVQQYTNGNLSVTNSTFNNNSVGNNGEGGAIYVSASGGTGAQTFVVNILRNNFINNKAILHGGAITTVNSFATNNTWNINYNRFIGNTATTGSALETGDVQGNVDATNNWWGCNGGATACNDKALRPSGSLGGTLTTTPYLTLTSSLGAATLCSGTTTTATASFTTNSASSTITTANLFPLIGLPVTFSAVGGTVSNQQTTIQANGTATATYTGTAGGAGSVGATVDNATSTNNITVNAAPSLSTQPPAAPVTCAGTTISIAAAATGSGTLSYQWFKGATALTNTGTTSNTTTNTLTITNPTTSDAGTYSLKVSSSTGCTAATSNGSVLTVNALPSIATQPPATPATCAGATISIAAAATGSGTLGYQWFKGASALTNTGNISNATTNTLTITNPTTSDAGTYNLRVSSSTGCTAATSNSSVLTVNALPSIATQPGSVTTGACTGNPVTFTASGAGDGTLSFRWYLGSTALNDGAQAGKVSSINGSSTTTLTINNPSTLDNATTYNVKVSSTTGCTAATSNNVTLTVSTPATATATTNGSKTISSTNTIISDASCNLITTVTPSGTSPVSGSVAATVTVQGSVQTSPNGSPYVQRHYDIVPNTNASAATATVVLYFTQAEFTAYNASTGHGANLPIDGTDAANNKANIRIYQYHGTGTAPGNYAGTSTILTPTSNVYNGTYARWEVTASVTGFSGFYLASTGSQILPLQLLTFTGTAQSGSALLQWTTANEINTSRFDILRSTNGIDFTKIAQTPTTGNGTAGTNIYQYKDALGASSVYYYQLKMVDLDNRTTTSNIVAVNNALVSNGYLVKVTPNPFRSQILVNVDAMTEGQLTLELVDMNGKKLMSQSKSVTKGINTIFINDLGNLANGTYTLHLFNGSVNQTIKLLKAK